MLVSLVLYALYSRNAAKAQRPGAQA
jgi:hypothetical protein